MKTKFSSRKRIASAALAAGCACVLLSGMGLQSAVAADTIIDRGTWSTTPWTLDAKGDLVLGKAGSTTNLETLGGMPADLRPGAAHNKDVKSVRIAKGATIDMWGSTFWSKGKGPKNPTLTCSTRASRSRSDNTAGAFAGFPNLKRVDLTGARHYRGWLNFFGWPISYHNLFCDDPSLTDVVLPEHLVEGQAYFEPTYVNDLSGMFFGDTALEKVDLSKLDTSKVINFKNMFGNDKNLRTIRGIESLNMSAALDFSSMFEGASSLESLNLSRWEPAKLLWMQNMFSNMKSLQSLNIKDFPTPPMGLGNPGPIVQAFEGTTHLRELTVGKDFAFNNGWTIYAGSLDGGAPKQNGAFGDAPVIKADGTIKPADHQPGQKFGHRYYTGLWQEVGTGTPDRPTGRVKTIQELATSGKGESAGTWVWQPQTVKYDSVKVPQTGKASLNNDLGFRGDGQHGVNWDGNQTTVEAGKTVTVLPAGQQQDDGDATRILAVRQTTLDLSGALSWADKSDKSDNAVEVKVANPDNPLGAGDRVKLDVTTKDAKPGTLYTVFANYKTNLPARKSNSLVFAFNKGYSNMRVDSYVYVQAAPKADPAAQVRVKQGQTVVVDNHASADPHVPVTRVGEWGPNGQGSLGHFNRASIVKVTWKGLPAGVDASPADPANPAAGVKFTVGKNADQGNYKIQVTYTDDLGQSVVSTDTLVVGHPYEGAVKIYRLHLKSTGEHRYVPGMDKAEKLVKAGWTFDGYMELAPAKGGDPVYMVSNPAQKDSYYTTDLQEAQALVKFGWKMGNDGKPVFYSGGKVDVYQLYNPTAKPETHFYTANLGERNKLVKAGWIDQGVAWQAVGHGDETAKAAFHPWIGPWQAEIIPGCAQGSQPLDRTACDPAAGRSSR